VEWDVELAGTCHCASAVMQKLAGALYAGRNYGVVDVRACRDVEAAMNLPWSVVLHLPHLHRRHRRRRLCS
jgi:hypothetical protein